MTQSHRIIESISWPGKSGLNITEWTHFWYYISCPCRTYLWDLRVWEISLIAIITSRCVCLTILLNFLFPTKCHIKSGIYWQHFSLRLQSCVKEHLKTYFLPINDFFRHADFVNEKNFEETEDERSLQMMSAQTTWSPLAATVRYSEERRRHANTLPWGHMVTGYRVSVLHSTGGEREIFIHSYRPQYQSQAFFIVSNYSYKHVIISLRTFYAILGAKKLFIFCNSKL